MTMTNENAINGFETIPTLHHGMSFIAKNGLISLVGQNCSHKRLAHNKWTPEYVRCFSLCPTYSIRQLRRIDYIQHKYRHGKRSPFNIRFYRNVPIHKQLDIKRAFGEAHIRKPTGGCKL